MFQILSDGSCDLSAEQLLAAGIEIIPFYISFDGKTYQKEATELGVHDFYEFCVSHPDVYPRTSMPSVQDYIDVFRKYLSDGTDILCYCLTEKFSGSYSSAMSAAAMLAEEYPKRQIRVVNSTLATGLFGLLLLELSRYAKEGHTLEETYRRGEEIKKSSAIFFTVENFSYLTHGGRIGKLMEMAMTGIQMRPVIRFGSGELYPVGLSRSRKNAFARIVRVLEHAVSEYHIDSEHFSFAIGWGYDRKEAEPLLAAVSDMLLRALGRVPDFVPIQIGATIGVHVGPHPVGVGFIEKA